jgi:hypothetical protein
MPHHCNKTLDAETPSNQNRLEPPGKAAQRTVAAAPRKSFSNSSRGVPFLVLSGTRRMRRSCSAVKSGLFLGSSF